MRVKINQLKEGCILTADVNALSNTPIIPKKAVVNKELLEVMKAFLIYQVEVEEVLENGQRFKVEGDGEEENEYNLETHPFLKQYMAAVTGYKKLFKNWQAGSPIDIPKLREALVSFLDLAFESPNEVFRLHHYGTKEDYFYHHAVSVAVLSSVLAGQLNYQKGERIQIGLAGALSDCGMAKIDPWIINKKGNLTDEEFQDIKKHPTHSFQLLKQVSVITDSLRKAVLQHHERMDGSGYPLGITSENLHPYAKIISVADTFHAMTSERYYKPKQSPFKVLETIIQDNFGKFDLRVVQALTKALTNFSSGTRVLLNNNQAGEIVFVEQQYPTRPMVRLDSGEILQLTKERQLFIEDILG